MIVRNIRRWARGTRFKVEELGMTVRRFADDIEMRRTPPGDRTKLEYHLAKMGRRGFEAIRRKHQAIVPRLSNLKHLDRGEYLGKALRVALALGLDQGGKRTILDLGTGPGYFPFVCRNFGHEVRTIDLDADEMYNDFVRLLRLPRRVSRIKAFEPIAPFDVKFDLITGFMVCFNLDRSGRNWQAEEWAYLMEDLLRVHLKPGGELYFDLNSVEERDALLTGNPFLVMHPPRVRLNTVHIVGCET